METTAPPARRRIALLLAVLIAGTAAGIWYIHSRLDASGFRWALAAPGAGVAVTGTAPPVAPNAELAAAGVRVETIGIFGESEQVLFLRRDRTKLMLWVAAAKEPLQVNRLGYVLFDADGGVLGEGVLQPDVRIEPGQKVSTEINDARLSQAARVEVRKLP